MSKIVSFAGLAATFIVAYACDRWGEFLRVEASRTFAMAPYLWLSGAANLLLALALFLLLWYVIFRATKSTLVSALFVLIGLGLTFAAAVGMSLASPFPPFGIVEFSTPGSHVLYVSAFVTVIGIAGFILPKRLNI
jgi:hypothetical protein